MNASERQYAGVGPEDLPSDVFGFIASLLIADLQTQAEYSMVFTNLRLVCKSWKAGVSGAVRQLHASLVETEYFPSTLASLGFSCQNVSYLDVSNKLTNDSLQGLKEYACLSELNLSHCSILGPTALSSVLGASLRTLKSLTCRGSALGSFAMGGLSLFTKLESLDLRGCIVSASSLEGLSSLTGLNMLDISFVVVTEQTLQAIALLRSLERLDMVGCMAAPGHGLSGLLVTALSGRAFLLEADLSENCLSDDFFREYFTEASNMGVYMTLSDVRMDASVTLETILLILSRGVAMGAEAVVRVALDLIGTNRFPTDLVFEAGGLPAVYGIATAVIFEDWDLVIPAALRALSRMVSMSQACQESLLELDPVPFLCGILSESPDFQIGHASSLPAIEIALVLLKEFPACRMPFYLGGAVSGFAELIGSHDLPAVGKTKAARALRFVLDAYIG